MQIQVNNPEFQTIIFGILFLLTLLLSIRKTKFESFFATPKTVELKGFAILAIIFSHIGYSLSTNSTFLYPFSILAGVGVNLFLFLSGFGLTLSMLKSPASPLSFYKKRLKKLFVPMWMVISLFLLTDLIFLNRNYPLQTILQNFFGFFPRADVFKDLDSPLWYFTVIAFYYLIYPLLFIRKFTYLSPFLIWLVSFLLLKQTLPINPDVINLYKLHNLAFPIGILFALLLTDQRLIPVRSQFKKILLSNKVKYVWILLAAFLASYTSIHSGVGTTITTEQLTSLVTMFLIIFIFTLKDFEFRIFSIFGKYSYEIYLIHWPILARYGLIYQFLPAYLSTYIYLIIFLSGAYLLQKLQD
ncbi:MAG: acyltransferase [Candidatus Daviesbacteria bacterium]|nr:acyltransferase [Candidatus Daviesbacteria bacterium]